MMSLARRMYLVAVLAALCVPIAAVSVRAARAGTEFVTLASAATKWDVPASAEARQNPVPADAKAIAAGKSSFDHNCTACHGTSGKGDGPAAPYLQTHPGNLSDPGMWKYSDGNLFYKITEGRSPMPTYRTMLTDEQRWQVVDYIRTLAPKPADK
jgi:mono/diheme cytochrome c family protein